MSLYYPEYEGNISGSAEVVELLIDQKIMKIDDCDLRYIKSLYQGEITYMDHQLGRIMDLLEKNNLSENTLLLLISDHGEEFKDHGCMTHGKKLYEESIRIPMIFSLDKILPHNLIPSTFAELIDIPPTILDLIGADIPET